MPVGAKKGGRDCGGQKHPKDRSEEKKTDSKEPESPAKLKSPAAKSVQTDSKQTSSSGKTALEHLQDARVKVVQAGGPDIHKNGWICKLVPSSKIEGAAAGSTAPLDPCWVEPESGKEFFKRKNVLKFFGLQEPAKVTREEAALASREKFKELEKTENLPHKFGEVEVLRWGKVAADRESFHNARYIWPIGFKSRWIDEKEQDVTYESEIRDGKEECGAPDALKNIDAPIFVVCVTRKGEDKPTQFFGKNGKSVWRKATKDETAKDRTGLRDEEVCKRVEGMKHAASCKNYEFFATRPPLLDPIATPKKKSKKKKSKASNGDTDAKAKISGKKRKAGDQPKTESKKSKRAREREDKLQEKAREKEEKEKKQQAVAEERRLVREEEARKRKEAKELQDIEQKWLSRYPIEDLAIELETKAMEGAKAAGHDIPAQRAAARAVVDAVERGWGRAAILAAAKEAAESRTAGDTDEEAAEKAAIKGEEVHDSSPATNDTEMDVDDSSVVDNVQVLRVGTRVRMLFKTGENDSNEHKNISIDFYDENDVVEVPKGDQDVEVLAQGLLRLSPLVQKPQRAATHCADLLTVARFVEAYKLELKLVHGKGDLTALQDGLENPANSEYLSYLYQALLVGAMEATKEANPNAIVPAVWQGDNTLTQYTWPEIARRWITCGPHAELNKMRFPEAVAAATCLPAAPGGAKSRPEGHLKLLLCLIEDCYDHPDFHSAIEHRQEVSADATNKRDDDVKEFAKEEKDAQQRIIAAKEAVAKADVGEEGTDAEPMPDEATKKAIESASMRTAANVIMAHANGDPDAIESEEAKALRVAFEEKHAEWKKRRDDRGGKVADKELAGALKEEKKLNDHRIKSEKDFMTKLERFCWRQAPLGMDRHQNKYWWFPCDPATLYVEPAMPSTGKIKPDPVNFSLEWRMWCGAEAMKKLADCLCEQGVRESELKAGILKIIERLTPEQTQSTVRDQLKLVGVDHVAKDVDYFSVVSQEARNIHEILNEDQRRTLAKDLPGCDMIMESALDFVEMPKLLQHLETVVHESLVHNKRKKRDSSAIRVQTDSASTIVDGRIAAMDPVKREDLVNDLPEEWQNHNVHITKRVRRNVFAEDGSHAGKANGTIVGYIPKEKSDFKSKQTQQDAALWRLKFDDPDIQFTGEGFEDIEEFEVLQAIQDYEKMQASLHSAASLRGGVVPTRSDAAEDSVAQSSEVLYDEGAIDMAEASNKVTGDLWTSAMQRDAWRREVESAASSKSVVRLCYSASVLCENVLRVMGKTRNDLSSAPRRTRTDRTKRSREVAELGGSVFTGFTESGRRVKRVNYAENQKDSDDSD